MAVIFIKHFFIMLCSTYTYSKLLNIKSSDKWIIAKTFALSLIATIGVYFVRQYAVPVSIYFMVVLSEAYNISLFKLDVRTSITGTVVSFGIVYCAFELGALSVSLLEGFFIFFTSLRFPKWSFAILLGLIQSFLVFSFFNIRRLRKGMPFLIEHSSSELGVYMCVSMLIAISIWSSGGDDSRIYIIPAFFVFISGMILWFWWRTRMTTEYLNRLREKEINSLNDTISKQNVELQHIKFENEELSKIIHRDNKLIPALELSVREYLSDVSDNAVDHIYSSRAAEILQSLERVSQERANVVKSYESRSKKLLSTGITLIDVMLSYLQQKAASVDVDFNLTSSCSACCIVDQQLICEQDLRTMLADLIDNAIIATKNASRRSILVNFCVLNNTYFIEIFDSGTFFELSTLANAGLIPASTHLNDGGSGIGLMNSFELCKKYHVSFEITEFPDDSLFTKKVSLCFDRLGEYRIKTPRAEAIKAFTQREDIHYI